MTNTKRKNRHGRHGVKPRLHPGMRHGRVVSGGPPPINTGSRDYHAGYDAGYHAGYALGMNIQKPFLEGLLDKRRIKEVHGLIEARLATIASALVSG